jgi:hypothetical protein
MAIAQTILGQFVEEEKSGIIIKNDANENFYVCERAAIPHIPRAYRKSDYSVAAALADYCIDLERYGYAVKGLEVSNEI